MKEGGRESEEEGRKREKRKERERKAEEEKAGEEGYEIDYSGGGY